MVFQNRGRQGPSSKQKEAEAGGARATPRRNAGLLCGCEQLVLASQAETAILAIMARNVLAAARVTEPASPPSSPRGISLTPRQGEFGQPALPIRISVSELIAYSEQPGWTRLNLTGNKTLDVRETTSQIDLLVRAASS